MRTTGSTIVATDHRTSMPPEASARLAELVVHLTDCEPRRAVAAVDTALPADAQLDTDARLAVVAAAMVAVRRPIDLRDPKPPVTPAAG